MAHKYLAFSMDTLYAWSQGYENGHNVSSYTLHFFRNDANDVILVTDICSSKEEAKAVVKAPHTKNKYHGSDKQWKELASLNAKDLFDGGVSPEVVIYNLSEFDNTFAGYYDYMHIHDTLRSIRRDMH